MRINSSRKDRQILFLQRHVRLACTTATAFYLNADVSILDDDDDKTCNYLHPLVLRDAE